MSLCTAFLALKVFLERGMQRQVRRVLSTWDSLYRLLFVNLALFVHLLMTGGRAQRGIAIEATGFLFL
jgi:hypothetical protein